MAGRAVLRILERRPWATLSLQASLATLAALGSTTASCSRFDYHLGTLEVGDESPEQSREAGVPDARIEDAAFQNAAPPKVVCETSPCAVALTTTLRATETDRGEGYCALLADGAVACWGTNVGGQLGRGDVGGPEAQVATRVMGLSGVAAIDHTCAVDGTGAVWCWGTGPFLQSDASAVSTEASPVRVPLPGAAKRVAVTRTTGCALLVDERVVCWGANERLQVAREEATEVFLDPREITLPSGVKELVVSDAAFALYGEGTVLSWGRSPSVGRATPFTLDGWPAPLAIDHVAMLDTVDEEVCAVAGGVGWCWGAAIPPASGAPVDRHARALPAGVATPGAIARIATSRTWTVREGGGTSVEPRRWCATSVAGEVFCWGLNTSGQAGDGTRQYALEPVVVADLPAPAVDVKVMPYSTCALLAGGKVYCWGNNFHGQLGAGLPKGSSDVPREVKLP